MNFISITGNSTKDGELLTFGENKACKFTIADNYKKKGEEHVNYFECIAWGKTAEFAAEYIKKGSNVCVFGKVEISQYETAEGVKKNQIQLTVSEFKAWK